MIVEVVNGKTYVRNFALPVCKHGVAAEHWVGADEYVVLGTPYETSEHDCDLMGCSSVGYHVLERGKLNLPR